MTQTKALASAITDASCNSGQDVCEQSKIHPGSILVNSAVRRSCEKQQENIPTVPQSDVSS